MKKKLLILAVLVMAVALCLSVSGIASASDVTAKIESGYYIGEYGDIFAGHHNEEVRKEYFGTEAVILFGQVSGLDEEVKYEYGIVIYPSTEDETSKNAILFPAKSASKEGKFGIAISLSGNFVGSGVWSAKTYLKEASAPLTPKNCTYSAQETTFSVEQYGEPEDVSIARDGTISWNRVEGANEYKIQAKWENELFWEDLGTVKSTEWNTSDYLKSLSADKLKSLQANKFALRITALGADKLESDPIIVDNALGHEYSYKVDKDNNYVLDDNGNKIITATYDYRLAVVEDLDDLTKYVNDSSKFWYIVLANDIEIGTVTPSSLAGKDSIVGVSFSRGVLDGLGRTISYKYVDTTTTGTGRFNGLFNSVASDRFGTRMMNLVLDVEGVTAKPNSVTDDWFFCALGYQFGAHAYDCYFKMRVTTTNQPSSAKSRAVIVQRLSGADTANCNALFENCVFDMVTYGSDGNPRQLGTSQCDALIAWQNLNGTGVIKNKAIKNCVYVTNTSDVSKRGWTSYDGTGINIIDSHLYPGASEFAAAWNSGELNTDALSKAGWSVDEYSIRLNGEVIYSIPYNSPSNLTLSNVGLVTWGEVEDAEAYKLRVKWEGGNWIDLPEQTVREWDLTTYLKSMTEQELKAKEGKTLTFAVSAIGSLKPDSNESVINNVLGTIGTTEYRLRVATNIDEFISYTTSTNMNYTVMTRDISVPNVAKATANQSYSIAGASVSRGTINGLGHTLSYVYDDSIAPPTANSTSFYGLFVSMGGDYPIKVLNFALDANITSARSTVDDWHASAFTQTLQAEVYNSYFKVRGYTPNLTTASNKSRILLSMNMVSSSTGSVRGSYENCIFDMVTYDKNGAVRPGGTTYCDTLIARYSRSTNAYMFRDIRNCSFIMNQDQGDRPWSEMDQYINIIDSAFYKDFDAFSIAWENDTLLGKANYQKAGYSVNSALGTVSFNGKKIYEKSYATPQNAKTSKEGILTWDSVDGATQYDVYAEYGDGNWMLIKEGLTSTSYDLNLYLKSLEGNSLKAIDGKTLNVAVTATGSVYADSEKAKVGNALGIVGSGKVRVAYDLDDLRTYCTADSAARNYIILANDIDLGTFTDATMLYKTGSNGTYGFIIASEFIGDINGLGRKITYTYNGDGQRRAYENGIKTDTPYTFCGLFDLISSTSSRLLNLRIEATGTGELTTQGAADLWWTMLARGNQGVGYNCYFKLRYTCTNTSTTQKTRTGISWQACMPTYENCIFDMVTFDANGNMRAAGSQADCEIGWESPSSNTILTKCAYITTTDTTNRNIGCRPDSYTAMYKDFAAFITAWNAEGDPIDKDSYIDGGWSVDGSDVYLYGNKVNA